MPRYAVCPGSLVPAHWHDEALLDLLSSRLNNQMINFVTEKVVEAVRCRPADAYLTPPDSPGTSKDKPVGGLPPLATFIKTVVRKSRCHVPTLLASAVYLERLRVRLPTTAQGCPTTRHRCALAAIVLAAKYLNDSSPMNKHWARYSEFSLAEINLMEMQLLAIFNYDLRFDEVDLIAILKPLLAPPLPDRPSVRNSMPEGMRYVHVEEEASETIPAELPDSRPDAVVPRGRHYSVDAAALAVAETGEAGKQLTPAYQRAPGPRPKGPLPLPPSPIPPPPRTAPRSRRESTRSISFPRHRRPGSTTPLSSPPLEDLISPYTRSQGLSSRSSSSTLSSASSGPLTPHTPPTSHIACSSSPIPPVPHSITSGHKYSDSISLHGKSSTLHQRKRTQLKFPAVSRTSPPTLSYGVAHDSAAWPLVTSSGTYAQSLRRKHTRDNMRDDVAIVEASETRLHEDSLGLYYSEREASD
ncbi:hypothetical protein JCM10212_000991 [Sporobolomyces blumeae]